jgi:uncharacterized protein (DUF433 family)
MPMALEKQRNTLPFMSETSSLVQRSFRLSASTSRLLDHRVGESGESRNAMVDRLLNESLRIEKHPFIRFVTGASGKREAHIVGTRWKVRQIIVTLKGEKGQLDSVIKGFDLTELQVRAAVSYYADFSDEIDADIERESVDAEQQRVRWEREQSVIG